MRLAGLVLALVLALGAGVVVLNLFKKPDVQPQAVSATGGQQDFDVVNVLVASRPIAVGEVVAPEMLDTQPWPEHLVLNGFITGQDAVSQVVKMVARSSFQQGEPITMSRLSNPNDPSFLAAGLAQGMRAVTIASDGIAGVAGFVYPGDRVDVLVTHAVPKEVVEQGGERTENVTETLLTNVRVLAVDQRASGATEEDEKIALPTSISLEVSLEDAQKLRLGQATGELSLALRGLGAGEDMAVPPLVRLSDLSQADVFRNDGAATGGDASSVVVIRGVTAVGGQDGGVVGAPVGQFPLVGVGQ